MTITGANFTEASAVQFGSVPAASFSVDPSGNTITAVTPAHAATIVDVTVTGPGGDSAPSDTTKFLFGLGRWHATGTMGTPRSGHTATLLSDGRVLVTGGGLYGERENSGQAVASAEVYDPKSGGWSRTGDLTVPRAHHTATLLTGPPCQASSPPVWCGKVLITGGASTPDPNTGDSLVASAELYDPDAIDSTGRRGSFTALSSSMSFPRSQHTATLLPDGTVLLADGCSPFSFDGSTYAVANCSAFEAYTLTPSADIFDPATASFSKAVDPGYGRVGHTATLLSNGKVLFVGGTAKNEQVFGNFPYYIKATIAPPELYDPATKGWAELSQENDPRADHSAALLPSGKVLIAGGSSGDTYPTFKKSAELYDLSAGSWSNTSLEKFSHSSAPAVLLPSGLVLIASGAGNVEGLDDAPPYTSALSELFDPSGNAGAGSWLTAMPTLFGRGSGRTPHHTVTLLSSDPEHFAADPSVCGDNCGKVLVTGGENARGYGPSSVDPAMTDTAELYTPTPTITAISPTSGPTGGGTAVTITGTGFTHGVSEVRFGNAPAASFTVDSFSQITAVSPASAAVVVPVTVLNDGGKAVSSDTFTYGDGSAGPGPGAGTGQGAGSGPAPGPVSRRDTTRPVISGLAVFPARFTIGSLMPRLAHVARVGTTIRFSLSERAAVRLSYALRRSGRRVGHRCRPATFLLRHRPRCARYVTVSPSVSFARVRAGANRVRFQGRLSRTRTLRAGHYRVTARATDPAGNRSKPQRALLTAKRG